MRDIVKVRKVGETLVVTITQAVLSEVDFKEGDRVVIEPASRRRVIITKEVKIMANGQRTQLELNVLESKKHAIESEMKFVCVQNKLSIPLEPGMGEADLVELRLSQLANDCAKVDSQLAEKRLELFDLQGALLSD